MKILVIGNGGREHALAWKISKSPKVKKIFCAPGNAGTAELAQNIEIPAEDTKRLLEFALKEKIDLTVVGPEAPLANGIVDTFSENGLKIFGPTKQAAMLEASKAYAKQVMQACGIPTPKAQVISNIDEAMEAVQGLEKAVVKADGLASGKGVFVCHSKKEIMQAVNTIMQEKIFGKAGEQIITEELLEGEEASVLAFCDGESVSLMVPSQDHKPVFDNDTGPNTGGMGAYSPAPIISQKMLELVEKKIIKPVANEMKKRGAPFTGVLYAGLMIVNKKPFVLEFNARFGDPETQVILPRLESDLVEIMLSCTEKKLGRQKIIWSKKAAACVVLASGGYPEKFEKGKEITGLKQAGELSDVVVFHAGTKQLNGKTVTNGGRVLGVTALGNTVKESIQNAYNAVTKISFEKMHYRKDIGKKALKEINEKEELRKLILNRRNLLSPQEIREKSIAIREKLVQTNEFQKAKNVFTYISFGSEVRTKEIIEKSISLGKKVLVPITDSKSNEMIVCEFLGFEKLKKSGFGVMEPAQKKLFPVEKIDLVLVPGVAFDAQLNRIGFGKGFFDQFLPKIQPQVPTIALAFELQIVSRVPTTNNDAKVKKILTEKREITENL